MTQDKLSSGWSLEHLEILLKELDKAAVDRKNWPPCDLTRPLEQAADIV